MDQAQLQTACRCGHGYDRHEHYRSGTDCGTCGSASCRSFRSVAGPQPGSRLLLVGLIVLGAAGKLAPGRSQHA